jgi:hypothetical protein
MTPTSCKDKAGARTPNGNRDSRRCFYCGGEFKPRRRSARFCSSTCRVAAHRRTGCNANSTTDSLPEAPPASQTGSEAHSPISEPKNASAGTMTLSVTEPSEASIQPCLLKDGDVTLTAPILRGSKPLPWKILPDTKWPGMYRIRRPDDTLTAMVSLTRAKDALAGWCHEAP